MDEVTPLFLCHSFSKIQGLYGCGFIHCIPLKCDYLVLGSPVADKDMVSPVYEDGYAVCHIQSSPAPPSNLERSAQARPTCPSPDWLLRPYRSAPHYQGGAKPVTTGLPHHMLGRMLGERPSSGPPVRLKLLHGPSIIPRPHSPRRFPNHRSATVGVPAVTMQTWLPSQETARSHRK